MKLLEFSLVVIFYFVLLGLLDFRTFIFMVWDFSPNFCKFCMFNDLTRKIMKAKANKYNSIKF